jgi:hypothetical protein
MNTKVDESTLEQQEKPLNPAEFDELQGFIFANQRIDPPMSKMTVTTTLIRYSHQYSLPAIYRYLQWAIKNGEETGQIMATIIHDLNSFTNGDEFFSPRTSSY